MTLYHAVAWCDRTFTAQFEVEADNPEAALAKAKEAVNDAPAEECDSGYPWDTFLINDEAGNQVAAEEPGDTMVVVDEGFVVPFNADNGETAQTFLQPYEDVVAKHKPKSEKANLLAEIEKLARQMCTEAGHHPDAIGHPPNNDGAATPDDAFPRWMTWRSKARQEIAKRQQLGNAPQKSGWILKDDFIGEPNTAPLGWWWSSIEREGEPYLDEILLDENGRICGKGGCGADYYSHVMLAGFERPKPPKGGASCR